MKTLFSVLLFFIVSASYAQIGVGTTTPVNKLHVLGDTAQPAGTGSATNSVFRISNSTDAAVLDMGLAKDGYGWIQSRSSANYATKYPLVLNPNGGNVGIGTISPGAKLTVTGSIGASGTIRSTTAGQMLNCVFLNESDLGLSGTQDIATTTETNIVSYTYTPVSSSSKIFIEFDTKASVSGSVADEFASHIYVGTTEIQANKALWSTGQGGGGRGNAIFPISGYYTNNSSASITIYIKANRVNSDDTLTITHDNTLIIKEVAK